MNCGTTQLSAAQPPFIPTTGTVRTLVFFVKFRDDSFGTGGCEDDPVQGWPDTLTTLPVWANDFIDDTLGPPYTPGGLSDYFYQMSNGQYNFIGDVYFYLTPEDRSYYEDPSRLRGWLNRQIIDEFDATIDYSNYDSNSDGVVDMIIFIYRAWSSTFAGGGFQGIANLGFSGSIIRDGVEIQGGFPGSGTSQHNNYNLAGTRGVVVHEISHYFYDGEHFDYIGAWGIHDGRDGAVAMSGYERLLLNWVTPTIINSDTTDVVIKDAATTSDYYRININANEYFLLENRQQLSLYEQQPFCGGTIAGTGLMIAHIRPNEDKIDQIRWEPADGTFLFRDFGEATDTYKPGNKTEFTPWTTPNTNANDGSFTDIALMNIRQSNNDIIVDVFLNAPPAAPNNLVMLNAGNNGQHPVLQWDANTEPDLDHYTIYRGYNDLETGQIIWNSAATTTNTTWVDNDVTINTSSQTIFRYKITAVDDTSNESDYSNTVFTNGYWVPKLVADPSDDHTRTLPKQITLQPNYPNPFNSTTEIRFELPNAAQVSLKIYNLLGEEIRTLVNGYSSAGFHVVRWDGTDERGIVLPSGVYIYRMEVKSPDNGVSSFTQIKKMTLLR